MSEPDFSDLKIAVIQTGRSIEESRDQHGDYDDMCKALFGRAPEEADTFAVLDGEFPESLEGYDLVVVTGSKHGVYEPHGWIAPAEQLVRDAFEKGIKLVGICFGHQLIAQALGGTVEKGDVGFIVGAVDYEIELSKGQPTQLRLFAWHQDQVVKIPDGAEVIAVSDQCRYAGLKYDDRAITFQPHPEFTKAYMKDLIEARRGAVVSDVLADRARESLATPVDVNPIQKMLFDFAVAR